MKISECNFKIEAVEVNGIGESHLLFNQNLENFKSEIFYAALNNEIFLESFNNITGMNLKTSDDISKLNEISIDAMMDKSGIFCLNVYNEYFSFKGQIWFGCSNDSTHIVKFYPEKEYSDGKRTVKVGFAAINC